VPTNTEWIREWPTRTLYVSTEDYQKPTKFYQISTEIIAIPAIWTGAVKLIVLTMSLLGGRGVASTEASFEAPPPELLPKAVLFFIEGRVLPDRCRDGRNDLCVLCIPLIERRTSNLLRLCLNDLRILCIRERAPPASGEAGRGGNRGVVRVWDYRAQEYSRLRLGIDKQNKTLATKRDTDLHIHTYRFRLSCIL